MSMRERERIEKFYQTFSKDKPANYWSLLNPTVLMGNHVRQRELVKILNKIGNLSDKKILEIGCGYGGNLSELIRFGANPSNLIGNDLMEDRIAGCRRTLPSSVTLLYGDALDLTIDDESLDVCYQSTVFTSIVNSDVKKQLAEKMLRMCKPGGGILWFDFTYGNTGNVKGIKKSEIKKLFEGCNITFKRVHLYHWIGRAIQCIHPSLLYLTYPILHSIPLLRSHWICWIEKPIHNKK